MDKSSWVIGGVTRLAGGSEPVKEHRDWEIKENTIQMGSGIEAQVNFVGPDDQFTGVVYRYIGLQTDHGDSAYLIKLASPDYAPFSVVTSMFGTFDVSDVEANVQKMMEDIHLPATALCQMYPGQMVYLSRSYDGKRCYGRFVIRAGPNLAGVEFRNLFGDYRIRELVPMNRLHPRYTYESDVLAQRVILVTEAIAEEDPQYDFEGSRRIVDPESGEVIAEREDPHGEWRTP